MKKIYQAIASLVVARANCIKTNNVEWRDKHQDRIQELVKNRLPSGSGIDCGTKIDLDNSDKNKLVFYTSFHHMNDCGMYDGWTEHTITVRPSFDGIELRISGRNRNDIKDYLAEVYYTDLMEDEIKVGA